MTVEIIGENVILRWGGYVKKITLEEYNKSYK